MAYIRTKYCYTCEKSTQHVNHKCDDCEARKFSLTLDGWRSLPMEDKLVDLHLRLLSLESGSQIFK